MAFALFEAEAICWNGVRTLVSATLRRDQLCECSKPSLTEAYYSPKVRLLQAGVPAIPAVGRDDSTRSLEFRIIFNE